MDTTNVRDAFAPQTPDQLRDYSRSGGFPCSFSAPSPDRPLPALPDAWPVSQGCCHRTQPHQAMQHVSFGSAENWTRCRSRQRGTPVNSKPIHNRLRGSIVRSRAPPDKAPHPSLTRSVHLRPVWSRSLLAINDNRPARSKRPAFLSVSVSAVSANLRLFDRLRGLVGRNPQRPEKPLIIRRDLEPSPNGNHAGRSRDASEGLDLLAACGKTDHRFERHLHRVPGSPCVFAA